MTQRRIPAIFLALILLCGAGFSQEPKQLTLTLEDSIVRALKNNLNIAAEVITPGLASENVSLARQMYTPTLQVDLTGNRYEQALDLVHPIHGHPHQQVDDLEGRGHAADTLRRHRASLLGL